MNVRMDANGSVQSVSVTRKGNQLHFITDDGGNEGYLTASLDYLDAAERAITSVNGGFWNGSIPNAPMSQMICWSGWKKVAR